jgi:hypothetical protein
MLTSGKRLEGIAERRDSQDDRILVAVRSPAKLPILGQNHVHSSVP